MTARRGPEDRRRVERRSEDVRLSDYTLPRLRKAIITALLLAVILGLLVYMLHDMFVGIIAGVVVGAYLIPLQRWLRRALRSPALSAIITITAFTVPLIVLMIYSWAEISDAAEYLQENQTEVTERLTLALNQLPFTEDVEIEDQLSRSVAAIADQTARVVESMQEAVDIVVISLAVFLFTVFYILTDVERIRRYIRGKVPGRYRILAREVSSNIRAVVYGALYATFLTQLMKSSIVLGMNLILDVPLAIVLAITSFFIGFFPIVGSWVVYVPVAIYVIVFRGDVVGGFAMLGVGFFVNTLLLSLYLRPKIAAERSHVLNFYWMFIALVTGVYTFGLVGIIVGPVLLAVLKAIFDTITGEVARAGLEGTASGRAAEEGG